MSAPPYMKLYIADYHADTTHLNRSEHGAYMLLLMAMWRAGGKLPRNDAKLARIAKCSEGEWAEIKPVMMEFFRCTGGSISHKRVARELTHYNGVVAKRREAQKQSVSKKANKDNAEAVANAPEIIGICTHNHNQNQNQNHREEGSEDKSSGGEAAEREDFDATAWLLAIRVLVGQGAMKEPDARRFFGKVLAQHRLQARDILPSLTQAAITGTKDPKSYLTKAAQSVAKRREPVERQRVGFV